MERELNIDILAYEESKTKKKNRKKLLENLFQFVIMHGIPTLGLTEFETYSEMSRRSIYNYYKNAEEILVDLQIVVLHTYICANKYEIDERIDGYSNLEVCLQQMIQISYDNRDLLMYIAMFDNKFNAGYPDEKYMTFIRTIQSKGVLDTIIDKGVKDGTIRKFGDTSEISKSIGRTIIDSATRNIYRSRTFTIERIGNKTNVELLVNILLAGLKAKY